MKWRYSLLGVLFAPAAWASSLLVLTEPTARGYCGPLFDQWLAQVRHEGWSVRVRELPRWSGSYATNDWALLNRMSNEVARANPDAVQIVGRLAPLVSGGHAVDGHETRCVVTHQWLACTNLAFTDSTDWTGMVGTVAGLPSVIATNRPGDGRPDQYYGAFARPVAVLDASGMTSATGNFASGYLAGQPYQPTINEGTALRVYLTNNIAYRRSVWAVTETGYIRSDSWLNATTVTATNNSVSWTSGSSSVAGRTDRWLHHAHDLSIWSPNLVTAGGDWIRVFWAQIYKSYCMEDVNGQGCYRRHLFPGAFADRPLALVASWSMGNNSANFFWMGKAGDRTVADAIRSTAVRNAGHMNWEFPLAGDVTLPFDNAEIARPPGVAYVTNLTITTP